MGECEWASGTGTLLSAPTGLMGAKEQNSHLKT